MLIHLQSVSVLQACSEKMAVPAKHLREKNLSVLHDGKSEVWWYFAFIMVYMAHSYHDILVYCHIVTIPNTGIDTPILPNFTVYPHPVTMETILKTLKSNKM